MNNKNKRAPYKRSQTVLLPEEKTDHSNDPESERVLSENEENHSYEEEKEDLEDDEQDSNFNTNNKIEEKMTSNTPAWMLEAEKLLQKFDKKYESVKKYQSDLNDGFRLFDEKKKQFKLQGRQQSPQKKVVVKKQTSGLERLNYHLILLVITYVDQNPVMILQRLSTLSKSLKSKLEGKAIWREMVLLYFGKTFYKLNERKCEAAELQNPKRIFWKDVVLNLKKQFMTFVRTFKTYKTMICTRNISIPSLQKEVIASLSFFHSCITLKIATPAPEKGDIQPLFMKIFEEFVLREKFLFSLSYLTNNDFLPIRYDAISLTVSLFATPIYQIFQKEFDTNLKLSALKNNGLTELQHLKLLLSTGFFKNDKHVRFALDLNLNMIQVIEKYSQKMYLKPIEKERQCLLNSLFQNKQLNCLITLKNEAGTLLEVVGLVSMKKTGEVLFFLKDLKLDLSGKFSLELLREKNKLEVVMSSSKFIAEGTLTFNMVGKKAEFFKAYTVVYYSIASEDSGLAEPRFGILAVNKDSHNYLFIEILN